MPGSSCFRELSLRIKYRGAWGAPGEILGDFLVPMFSCAAEYCRNVGYFSSSYLTVAAAGFARFVNNGGSIRLLCGVQVYQHDIDAITGEIKLDTDFARRLSSELVAPDDIIRRRLEVIAWLYREGRLNIRIAIPFDGEKPYVSQGPGDAVPYWHKKVGYFTDGDGHHVSFSGSLNDSRQAMTRNAETISVFKEWDAPDYVEADMAEFDSDWKGGYGNFRVVDLPRAVKEKLLTFAPAEAPPSEDVCESFEISLGVDADLTNARATFALYAPRLENARGVAEATCGVTLQPHQHQVSYRLADLYPRSWIVADEVGLGKTISAGVSLRRLWLSKEVKRALILAPANLCLNWQNELFEKFGMWVPRLVNNTIVSPDPNVPPRSLKPYENPYLIEPLLIASSHLARRTEHAERVLEAARHDPFDIIIVDEAHHARFSGTGKKAKRNRLLSLLEGIHDQRAARALWLLTATPMQTSVEDLHCLLRVAGMSSPFDDIGYFKRYYEELVKPRPDWLEMQRVVSRVPVQNVGVPFDEDELAFLDGLKLNLMPSNIERIKHFTDGTKSVEATVLHADFIGDPKATEALRLWLRLHGPVERHVTRHTRQTLRSYIDRGLLNQRLAHREVSSPAIDFSESERKLFDELGNHIQRLEQAAGGHTGRRAFVLDIYRQRLTSSWAAIGESLVNRLEKTPMRIADERDDDDDDASDAESLDHTTLVPLLPGEVSEIQRYIARIESVRNEDSKFALLERYVSEARSSGQAIIIFTQFTDTLDYLRDKMVPIYRAVLATYTGDGGRRFQNGVWLPVSKADLVAAVRGNSVQILLATDAAAEGLNLQACSYLVNYDMPWNPMRVEQRIGRIDRLGQSRPTVTIKNFFVNEIERNRYRALADRIVDFNTYIGGLPPILGIVEPGFVRNPFDDTQASRITIDDQLPVQGITDLPITSAEYASVVRDDLRLDGRITGPITWDLSAASADPENWAAAATYGHPGLDSALERYVQRRPAKLAVASDLETGLAVIATTVEEAAPLVLNTIAELNGVSLSSCDTAGDVAEETLGNARRCRLLKKQRYEFQASPDTRKAGLRAEYIQLVREISALRLGLDLATTGTSPTARQAFLSAIDRQDTLHYLPALQSELEVPDQELFNGVTPRATTSAGYGRSISEFIGHAKSLFERYRSLQA